MTKKVTKKNRLFINPIKSEKPKSTEYIQSNHPIKFPEKLESASDWQAHHDFLETSPWGSGLFGAPMDKVIEEIAWRAVSLAIESGDKYKIARSYRHLFYFYCEFHHQDSLIVGFKSVVAAIKAFGSKDVEVGEEIAMLAVVHDRNCDHERAMKAREASINIFEENGTTERLLEALEMAILSASDTGRGDMVEKFARHGIRVVKERFQYRSNEYKKNMEYFEQMLDTAHVPPVTIEEQRRQLFEMFPNLQKGIEKIRREQMQL